MAPPPAAPVAALPPPAASSPTISSMPSPTFAPYPYPPPVQPFVYPPQVRRQRDLCVSPCSCMPDHVCLSVWSAHAPILGIRDGEEGALCVGKVACIQNLERCRRGTDYDTVPNFVLLSGSTLRSVQTWHDVSALHPGPGTVAWLLATSRLSSFRPVWWWSLIFSFRQPYPPMDARFMVPPGQPQQQSPSPTHPQQPGQARYSAEQPPYQPQRFQAQSPGMYPYHAPVMYVRQQPAGLVLCS